MKNRSAEVDVYPGEILERVAKQFEAQDYASDKPVRSPRKRPGALFLTVGCYFASDPLDWIFWTVLVWIPRRRWRGNRDVEAAQNVASSRCGDLSQRR